VTPRLAVRMLAAGRLAIGVAMMASPKLVMGGWVGKGESERPSVDLVTRAFGAREVLLGALGLHVADTPAGPRLLQALALCDATDLTLTILRRDELPRGALPLMVPIAGGAAVTQLWASRAAS
jgi:hypothetical protein